MATRNSSAVLSYITDSQIAKFWEYVDKTTGDCWTWTGYVDKNATNPLPKFQLNIHKEDGESVRSGVSSRALAWFLVNGEPSKNNLSNLCGNYLCVNPEHHMDSRADNRFWTKFKKLDNDCWEWLACKDKDGYGKFHSEGKEIRAHIYSWELHNGQKRSPGMFVCHKCDNPSCVNPDHLFLGTTQDNTKDMILKNRQAKGERAGNVKLNPEIVLRVRELREKHGMVYRKIAEITNVSEPSVTAICKRRVWKHI